MSALVVTVEDLVMVGSLLFVRKKRKKRNKRKQIVHSSFKVGFPELLEGVPGQAREEDDGSLITQLLEHDPVVGGHEALPARLLGDGILQFKLLNAREMALLICVLDGAELGRGELGLEAADGLELLHGVVSAARGNVPRDPNEGDSSVTEHNPLNDPARGGGGDGLGAI